MKFILIGFCILLMFVTINVATKDAIHLIASKGAVPYSCIRESQSQFSQASVNEVKKGKMRTANSISLERADPIVFSADSSKRSYPIRIVRSPVADMDEENGAESLIGFSISPCSNRPKPFPLLCPDVFSIEDDERAEELLDREGAKLVFSTSDEDLFSSDTQWVRLEFFESQGSEGHFPTIVAPRPSATVTFTRTNAVTEVQFGLIPPSAFGHGNSVNARESMAPSPTPINKVQRTLRPSTRTEEGRLKEAQINHMLPIKFGTHPKTREERVVLVRRGPECLTPFINTDQTSQVLPVQMCVSPRVHKEAVLEKGACEYRLQAELEDSQEVET